MILDSRQQIFVYRLIGQQRATLLALSECRGCRKIPPPALGILRQVDGRKQLRAYCPNCTTRSGRVSWMSDPLPASQQIVEKLNIPIVMDKLDPDVLCEHCGDGSQGVQEHHWAPRSIFGSDAYKWPTSYLCIRCHEEWHRRTCIADSWYRKAAA